MLVNKQQNMKPLWQRMGMKASSSAALLVTKPEKGI
jgi:hypothetical protein